MHSHESVTHPYAPVCLRTHHLRLREPIFNPSYCRTSSKTNNNKRHTIIIANGGVKYQTRAYTEVGSGTFPDGFFGGGTNGCLDNAEFLVPHVAVTASYIQLSQPNTSAVGQNAVPPINPGIPSGPPYTYNNPTYIRPEGWVLVNRQGENIPNTTVYLITDEYVHYYPEKIGAACNP